MSLTGTSLARSHVYTIINVPVVNEMVNGNIYPPDATESLETRLNDVGAHIIYYNEGWTKPSPRVYKHVISVELFVPSSNSFTVDINGEPTIVGSYEFSEILHDVLLNTIEPADTSISRSMPVQVIEGGYIAGVGFDCWRIRVEVTVTLKKQP